jgi:HD-like signal output (HDOD) protein
VANSAYYGQCSKVSSIRRAVVVLGFKTLGEIVILASSSKLLDKTLKGYGLAPDELWRHSLAVAFGSKIIANRKKNELANDAYIAGLLHDAGKLILEPFVLERKAIFDHHTETDGRSLHKAEKTILGFDHAEIAGIMCKKWNFPEPIYNAIRFHHYPYKITNNELAFITYTADKIAKWCVKDTEAVIFEIDDTVEKVLGIQDDEMELIMDEIITTIDQITDGTWEMIIKHYN